MEIKINKMVKEYLENIGENDFMYFGNDFDTELFSLSEFYKNILDKLKVKYDNVITKDISQGKYETTINFGNNKIKTIQTNAWDTIDFVTDNIIDILNFINK